MRSREHGVKKKYENTILEHQLHTVLCCGAAAPDACRLPPAA